MRRHLIEGCEPCIDWVTLIGGVRPESAAEPTVPQHLVDFAKSVFEKRRCAAQAAEWLSLPLLPAVLVYHGTLPAGGPLSELAGAGQLVYHAGDYAIDLCLEPKSGTVGMTLVGQVIERSAPRRPLSGVAVLLTVRNRPVASAQTSRLGEFSLVAPSRQGLKLCLQLETVGKRVEIPLNRIMAGHLCEPYQK